MKNVQKSAVCQSLEPTEKVGMATGQSERVPDSQVCTERVFDSQVLFK